jgi:hypothetical protein
MLDEQIAKKAKMKTILSVDQFENGLWKASTTIEEHKECAEKMCYRMDRKKTCRNKLIVLLFAVIPL